MPKGYHHLTYEQRCQIESLKGILSQAKIAKKLGVHPSTVSKELKRNSGPAGYFLKPAQELARAKRKMASTAPSKMTESAIAQIEVRLKEKWSPEQIAGYFKMNELMSISHESIYRHVWADKKEGGTLYQNLRHSGKKYNKRGSKTAGRSLIPNRVDISLRPGIVEEKSRKGDIEGDLIIGTQQSGAILSHVDRRSKFTKLALLPDKKATSVLIAIEQTLGPWRDLILTITYDNGMEFSCHEAISKMLGISCYFARPYHSWERGLNEHTNGLCRSPDRYETNLGVSQG